MNNKHRKMLRAIFSEPAPANLRWDAAVALVEALGGTVKGSGGSPHTFTLSGVRAVLHRPHPAGEMRRYAVRDLREFLTRAGIDPQAV